MLKPPGTKRFKLKCDIPLSKFAFNFNLRCYIMACQFHPEKSGDKGIAIFKVVRCMLTLSNAR